MRALTLAAALIVLRPWWASTATGALIVAGIFVTATVYFTATLTWRTLA